MAIFVGRPQDPTWEKDSVPQIEALLAKTQSKLDLALLPEDGDVVPPALDHAADVRVRAAQEEDLGPQRVAARQHRQVLLDDRRQRRGDHEVGESEQHRHDEPEPQV